MEHFRNKLVRGKAIGAQKNFAHNFNRVMLILENIKGVGGIVIKKEGIDWRIAPGPPHTPYEQSDITLTPPHTAWELTIDEDTATCVNCMLMLSTVTVMAAGDQMQLTCDLTGKTDGWLCGTLNTETETKVVGLAFTDPPTALQEDSEVIYYPLYKMKKAGGKWFVTLDARNMPRIGAYW